MPLSLHIYIYLKHTHTYMHKWACYVVFHYLCSISFYFFIWLCYFMSDHLEDCLQKISLFNGSFASNTTVLFFLMFYYIYALLPPELHWAVVSSASSLLDFYYSIESLDLIKVTYAPTLLACLIDSKFNCLFQFMEVDECMSERFQGKLIYWSSDILLVTSS